MEAKVGPRRVVVPVQVGKIAQKVATPPVPLVVVKFPRPEQQSRSVIDIHANRACFSFVTRFVFTVLCAEAVLHDVLSDNSPYSVFTSNRRVVFNFIGFLRKLNTEVALVVFQ